MGVEVVDEFVVGDALDPKGPGVILDTSMNFRVGLGVAESWEPEQAARNTAEDGRRDGAVGQ